LQVGACLPPLAGPERERGSQPGRCRAVAGTYRATRIWGDGMAFVIGGATLGGVLLGFVVAGVLSFTIKSHWCPACGSTLNCPVCMGAGAHRLPSVR
jgi:hypothetical protein